MNLSEFKVQTPSDEQVALNCIQGHIKAYIEEKHPDLTVHTILINKIAYYSATRLNLNLTRGWYLYGPCMDEYREREKTVFGLSVAAPVYRNQEPVVVDECKKHLAHYIKASKENDFYSYLEYIYRERSEYPELKEIYLAKNNLFRMLHGLYSGKVISENEVVRNFDAFNQALLSSNYQDFVNLPEDGADIILDYSFQLMECAIDATKDRAKLKAFHASVEEFNDYAFKALSDKHYAATVKSFSEERAKERKLSFLKAFHTNYHLARQHRDALKMELVKPMVAELGGRS